MPARKEKEGEVEVVNHKIKINSAVSKLIIWTSCPSIFQIKRLPFPSNQFLLLLTKI